MKIVNNQSHVLRVAHLKIKLGSGGKKTVCSDIWLNYKDLLFAALIFKVIRFCDGSLYSPGQLLSQLFG